MSTILMTDAQKEEWYEPLKKYYIEIKNLSEAKAKETIEKKFAEVQNGWKNAPKDLDTRIKMKTGYQWKSHSNLHPRRKEEEDISEEEVNMQFDQPLNSYMSKSEQKWWDDRLSQYKEDFDFNKSSDLPMIEQLLIEELIQIRLFKDQLKNPKSDYSKRLTDGLKRIGEIQTKLGITREQRAGVIDKMDGNVAQLALSLEEKIQKMPEETRKQLEEELYYEGLKKQKPPINMLPPIEKIEALLQVDGKVSANLDSKQISVITEEVGKEVSEQRELSNQKPPKKELAEGIDISR